MRARHLILILTVVLVLAGAPAVSAQGGHFELGAHYGRWTLNPLGHAAEKVISEAIDTELHDRILETIQADYPSLSSTGYSQAISFDSSGDNFGASLRWYPGGRRASFSLGFSAEKSSFKVLPTAAAQMQLQDSGSGETASFDGTANASGIIKATSFLLTFRWDILPGKAVHPYLTFGGGISTSKALDDSSLSYTYSGQLTGNTIPPDTVSGSDTKTLRQLRDEARNEGAAFPIPNFLPFVQVNLGLKVRLARMVHLLVDVGVLDGLIANAGLAIRL